MKDPNLSAVWFNVHVDSLKTLPFDNGRNYLAVGVRVPVPQGHCEILTDLLTASMS
jgi:hypothetical protein